MGGDRGTDLLIRGALAAISENKDLGVTLLGPVDHLKARLDALDNGWQDRYRGLLLEQAAEVVDMHESPVDAVRRKKNSTVMVGFDLIRQGRADALVSAGNSGATLAAAIRKLGRLPGISRPGLASFFPTLKKPVMLMDVGANVDCRPAHLVEFAVMAASCSRLLLRRQNEPRVGLLSNGEETSKGNAQVKEAHDLLRNSSLNFIGNVEGRDVYKGDVDVIVCDGFVGNTCLKVSEGLAEAAGKMLKQEIMKSWRAKLGYLLIRRAFNAFRKKVDYAEYGGAPLLGINGVAIICHGTSDSVAIKNAIEVGASMSRLRVNEAILETLNAWQKGGKRP